MTESRREVGTVGTIRWYKPGTDTLHREDGPAVEWANGDKYWYINGQRLTEEDDGRIVEIDGRKYKLKLGRG